MIPRAIKSCDANGHEWEERPSWWGDDEDKPAGDDQSLIYGVLQFGYGGFDEIVRQSDRFDEMGDARFDRLCAQKRLYSITRELQSINDNHNLPISLILDLV